MSASDGNILRIGAEEFRFYADVLPVAGAAAPASRPAMDAGAAPLAADEEEEEQVNRHDGQMRHKRDDAKHATTGCLE